MKPLKTLAVALAATAAAASLAGCATPTIPGSVEEQLWFDRAVGPDIYYVSPELRIRGAIGYPRTDFRGYREAPPPFEVR